MLIVVKDKIDRLYERKKFFRIIFNGISKDEYIRLFQYKKGEEGKDDYKYPSYWNDIDDLNNYIESHRFNSNIFFNLATTDGIGGAIENLNYRYCLAWDFDKKNDSVIDAKEIMFRFKKLNLYYHVLVDSGNGYHAYICINRTEDLKKVEDITKAIGEKLGADPKAMLQTQVLRVPYCYNLKNDKPKQVNIIKMYEKDTIKPYDIEELFKQYCSKAAPDRTIKYALCKSNFPPCIVKMLQGVDQGDRNFALKRLISFLKIYRYKLSEAWNIIIEWNYKNEPPIPDNELKYQFDYIWEKPYSCFGCLTPDTALQAMIKNYCNKEECQSKSKDEILFVEGETLQLEYKICKKLEPQKKGLQLKGNHLLLICILKNNPEGLNTDEIINTLTYKGKCCLSIPTVNKVLNDLATSEYVMKIKGNRRKSERDFYKMNDIKCEQIEKINLSYFAVYGVIQGNITTEDLRVYCYMRFRLSKGLDITQDKLADELNLTQPTISYHINNLLDAKYLELKYIDYSNGLGRNVYKINC